MALSLWDKLSEEILKDIDAKTKIDGGKYLAKILAIICQTNKREQNWDNGIYDDST